MSAITVNKLVFAFTAVFRYIMVIVKCSSIRSDWNTTKPDDVSTLHFINKVIRLNTALSHAPSVAHTDDIDIQVSPLRPGQKYDNIIVIFYSWINKIPVVGRKSYFFEQHGGQIFCHFLSGRYKWKRIYCT